MGIPHIGLPSLALNTNTIMAVVLTLVLLYGLLLGQQKLKTFALSAFVGLVMVITFADGLASIVQKGGGNFSLTVIKLVLFTVPVILLEFGHKEKSKGSGSLTVTLLLAVLTSALLISSVLSFLNSATVSNITKESILADWVYSFRLAWLIAVPATIVGGNFLASRKTR